MWIFGLVLGLGAAGLAALGLSVLAHGCHGLVDALLPDRGGP